MTLPLWLQRLDCERSINGMIGLTRCSKDSSGVFLTSSSLALHSERQIPNKQLYTYHLVSNASEHPKTPRNPSDLAASNGSTRL